MVVRRVCNSYICLAGMIIMMELQTQGAVETGLRQDSNDIDQRKNMKALFYENLK